MKDNISRVTSVDTIVIKKEEIEKFFLDIVNKLKIYEKYHKKKYNYKEDYNLATLFYFSLINPKFIDYICYFYYPLLDNYYISIDYFDNIGMRSANRSIDKEMIDLVDIKEYDQYVLFKKGENNGS